MYINLHSKDMYSDRYLEKFQKNMSKRHSLKEKIEIELMKNKSRILNKENQSKNKKKFSKSIDEKLNRQFTVGTNDSLIFNHNTTTAFEIFNTHTLVAKNPAFVAAAKLEHSTLPKMRSNAIIQPHQPIITLKPRYNNKSAVHISQESNLKLKRLSSNKIQQDKNRLICQHQQLIKVNKTGSFSTDSLKDSDVTIDDVTTSTLATDSSDSNPINFSSTLAKAATNSPPIKRRSLSLIHSPNPRMPARFASRSTINDIYTNKNYRENLEKYKKAANEILRENLALKFGNNNYFLKNYISVCPKSRSSISSTSSSSISETDQQISISSIPRDNLPLEIPDQSDITLKSEINTSEPISLDTQSLNKELQIRQDMETIDPNHNNWVNVDLVCDPDDDKTMKEYEKDDEEYSDDIGKYDTDDDQSSSCSHTSSESGDDIENLKKKFIPLFEIERLDEDFVLHSDSIGFDENQHSQSFRVENVTDTSDTEVFMHKESLQRAKNYLLTQPRNGIISLKSTELSGSLKLEKRKAIFDPTILLLDACLEPDFELVKELVSKVSNISIKTVDGITALHNAVCSADPDLVQFLLQSGADVNASDADGWTPLHCAACCNNKQISEILVNHGASLFAQTITDFEIPSQKCNKSDVEDTLCEEYLFAEQENLGVINDEIVYALFHYESLNADELTLVPNQSLKVIDTNPPGESGWFLAEDVSQNYNRPKKGFVAAAYVSAYSLILPAKQPDLIY